MQDDRDNFAAVADEVQLDPIQKGLSWHRHPLALLVEAADDVCYSILDIEDGARLGHVDWSDASKLMMALASKMKSFKRERIEKGHIRERIGYLRAMAITQLIDECSRLFLEKEDEILSGKYTLSLTDDIASHGELGALKELAFKCCYNAPSVVEIELAGYETLGGLLAHFIPAVSTAPALRKTRPGQERKALSLLRGRNVDVDDTTIYRRILRVTDLVSGMTDRYALSTYRRLKGISVPGRIG
jgi:dGTPase